jgi:hypothetical protein
MNTEPTQTCQVCGRVVIVTPDARGFPPNIAKRKLIKLCKNAGHDADPKYRAGITFGGPAIGM